MSDGEGETEQLSLSDAAGHLLDECRMVLPGIQALFGFQMVAVFNQRFDKDLSQSQQLIHLGATALVVLAIALLMAPAAWHRRVQPRAVSDRFIRISTLLLLASMMPLAAAISLDLYVVATLVTKNAAIALGAGIAAFCLFVLFWFALPARSAERQRA